VLPAHFDAAIQIFAHGVATLMRPPVETQVDQLLGLINTHVSELLQRVEATTQVRAVALQT